jgi:hypothetical protein
LPPLGIFLMVVGSIYAGLATPTEAAALGVLGALILAAWFRRLTVSMLREAIEGTMRATAMIMLIVIAASFLNFVMSAIGLTDALTNSITGLGLSPAWMLFVVVVFYLILGCFMETLSMMITTIPIVAPIMVAQGYDPIWLGIVIIVLVEAALVAARGLNLFVVQSVRKGGSMRRDHRLAAIRPLDVRDHCPFGGFPTWRCGYPGVRLIPSTGRRERRPFPPPSFRRIDMSAIQDRCRRGFPRGSGVLESIIAGWAGGSQGDRPSHQAGGHWCTSPQRGTAVLPSCREPDHAVRARPGRRRCVVGRGRNVRLRAGW